MTAAERSSLIMTDLYCLLSVERAIQLFENHFITLYSGIYSNFSKFACHHLLYQIVITLNMMRPSRRNLNYQHIYMCAEVIIATRIFFLLSDLRSSYIIRQIHIFLVRSWFTLFLYLPCYQTL